MSAGPTPTMGQVRDAIRNWEISDEAFDGWLASVKAEAKAEALTEVADHLAKPRILWSGDSGAQILVDEARLTLVPIREWLRERATAVAAQQVIGALGDVQQFRNPQSEVKAAGTGSSPPSASTSCKIVSQLEWLGTARAEYSHETCQREAQTAEQLARIIDGTNDATGWLPSWRWDEWAAIRAAAENGATNG